MSKATKVQMDKLLKKAKGFSTKYEALDIFESKVSDQVEVNDTDQELQDLYEAVSSLKEAMENLDNVISDIENNLSDDEERL